MVRQFINILQWNSQSLRPKQVDFDTLLNREKVHIALLSETWLEEDTPIYLRGYNICRKDRYDSYGGVAVIVHKSLNIQVCSIDNINPGIEALYVKVLNCKYLENIISIYCPSSVRTNQSDWDTIFSLASKKTLIAGDFNGHHCNWSYKSDPRGLQLFEAALEHNFSSLNSGENTRVKLVNGSFQRSSPDVSFLSTDIILNFNWQVLNENLGSDHLVIKITLNFSQGLDFVTRRNFKRANWPEYKQNLTNSFFHFDSTSCTATNIQEYYDYFLDQINISASKNIPITKIYTNPVSKFKPKEYWCPLLSEAVAKRRLALNIFRRNPTPQNLEKLEKKVAEARVKIKNAKRKSWQDFCSGIDGCTSVADMWEKMRWYKGCRRSSCVIPDLKKKSYYVLLHQTLLPITLRGSNQVILYWNPCLPCRN